MRILHRASAAYNLAVTHPHLLAEWHPSNTLKPTDIVAGSGKVAIWICPKGHIYDAPIRIRAVARSGCKTLLGCPYCSFRRVNLETSLASTHPHLLAEWHPSNTIKSSEISAHSTKKVCWICAQGHVWDAMIYTRALRGNGCPYCAGVKAYSLDITHPHLAAEWHPINSIKPSEVVASSNLKVKWICSKGHVWECSIANRGRFGQRCPSCAGRKPNSLTCLATTHPHLLKEWHPDNTISPLDILPGAWINVKWICPEGHVYESTPRRRTKPGPKRRGGCPFCNGKKVDPARSVAIVRPDLIDSWHPSNTIKLIEVLPASNKRLLWICPKGHVWRAIVGQRCKHGCPYCSNLKVAPDNCLATTHPHLVKEWHPSNTFKPTDVVAGSHKYVLWICEKGHEWRTMVKARTRPGRPTGCYYCDLERRTARFIRINYGNWEDELVREEQRK